MVFSNAPQSYILSLLFDDVADHFRGKRNASCSGWHVRSHILERLGTDRLLFLAQQSIRSFLVGIVLAVTDTARDYGILGNVEVWVEARHSLGAAFLDEERVAGEGEGVSSTLDDAIHTAVLIQSLSDVHILGIEIVHNTVHIVIRVLHNFGLEVLF